MISDISALITIGLFINILIFMLLDWAHSSPFTDFFYSELIGKFIVLSVICGTVSAIFHLLGV